MDHYQILNEGDKTSAPVLFMVPNFHLLSNFNFGGPAQKTLDHTETVICELEFA